MDHSYDVAIVIPGIQTAFDQNAWCRRVELWLELRCELWADSFQYRVKFFDRWLFQSRNVRRLNDKVNEIAALSEGRAKVTLICHSNGGEIACDLLRMFPHHKLKSVILISSACDADFRANGLNAHLRDGRVQHVHCLCSRGDLVLKYIAPASKLLFGWLGLGYGNLGYAGPRSVDPDVMRFVHVSWKNAFDHGTWFEPSNLPTTERLIKQALNEELHANRTLHPS